MVTGGAGFIGSHIVDALLSAGHSVAVVDDLSAGRAEHVDPRARLYRVSVTDLGALEEVFERERPELVNHHAAQTDVRRSVADPGFDALVNIVGSLNLHRLCVAHDVRRFIFASSCAVYSEPSYIPMDEVHPVGPQSPYGMSKYTVESYLRLLARRHGVRFKALRYGNVYGPRQDPKGEAGVVAIFAGQMIRGEQPTIYGDGTKTRDYIYVGDIVRANLLAMGEGGDDETYNVGRAIEVSDLEVFEAVRRAVGVGTAPVYAPKRAGEADRVSLDWAKARDTLGWSPAVALDQGVSQVVSYLRGRQRGAGVATPVSGAPREPSG